jgi:chromosome segregation ATPase
VENTVVIQPFWSILAACKALLTNANVFKGNSTIHKNNGGKFIHKDIENMVKMATVKINDSQIILRFLDMKEFSTLSSASNLKVKLNNIDWSFFKLSQTTNDKAYLIIYGLTPRFQYEIEVENNDVTINRLIINTTNNNSAIVESIAESSTMQTLRTSLLSTRESLFAFKNKFKRFKKEENKKISEVKNTIDNLKSKLSKYNNKPINDNRIFGKLKSLQHSVLQLETEIEQLKLQIDQLSKQEISNENSFNQGEAKYLEEINKLNDIMSQYESRINETKKALKLASNEQVSWKQKHDKLLHKHQTKAEEIKQLNVELKSAKKDITSKFSKRVKKIQENYDVVLLNVITATERLNSEYEALLDSKEYHEQT